jgi:c-di-GMP-binding flagellar brake protein YcgR
MVFVEGSMRRCVVSNRRRALRHAVQITCQVVRERDFRLIGDRIVDLSTSGMLVTPADPVLTGERLIASFRLPNSTYWIDVEATVARVVHGRRPSEHTRAIALEFDELPGLTELVLCMGLQSAPPVPPRTRPGRRSTPGLLGALLGLRQRILLPLAS